MREDFLGGVVEGFYGRPWTPQQRSTLFDQLVEWELNTYFYSPKDDLKHRAIWREPYDAGELNCLSKLVSGCNERGLRFIYGLSPGLDIRFGESAELKCIQARLQQMLEIGVRHFALLFDDLPGQMSDQDRQQFSSVAAAQASVTNAAFQWLQDRDSAIRLLFCPTPYCDRMHSWGLGGADYLDTLGQELAQGIDVLWTGPEIISQDIPVDSIQRLARRIGREPVIWDNLPANDYDLRRLYCGPYDRSPELKKHVRGILVNPNNEFPVNFVPLRTLGAYLKDSDYEPRAAYKKAITAWADRYATVGAPVDADDLLLLADCYYLPHAEGPQAEQLQQLVDVLLGQPVDQWSSAYQEFLDIHQRVDRLFEQFTQLLDRDLFYAWSRRIWELREELDLIKDFATAKQKGELVSGEFASQTHLQATCRGGMVARLQRKLVMTDEGRFRLP